MKLVILAGGLGTRLSKETSLRPKPMVEIGGRPILWHIMKTYLCHGVRDFVISNSYGEDWRVTLVDTGEATMTGGRLGRVAHLLRDEQDFCLTYGDGVADVAALGLTDAPRGTITLIVALFFLSGVQMLFVGMLGEYITAIHRQMKGGPLVVERETINLPPRGRDRLPEVE